MYRVGDQTSFNKKFKRNRASTWWLSPTGGEEEEGRKIFKPFFELGPLLDQTAQIPYESVNTLFNPIMQHGKYVYQTATYQLKSNVETAIQCLADMNKAALASNGLTPVIVHELYNPKKWMTVPKTETAFKREPTQNVVFMFLWPGSTDKEESAKNMTLARNTAKTLNAIVKAGQPGLTAEQEVGYSNVDSDAAEKGSDVKARLVFGENYDRLRRIKAKYDPENVFNRWFPITPSK